jgi:hypothetical protein
MTRSEAINLSHGDILEHCSAKNSDGTPWEGSKVKDFCLDEFGSFNEKYIAGVERLEDLSWIAPYWDFLNQGGFCLRIYSVPKEYVVRATGWQPRAIYYDSCSGLVSQCAFHWYYAKLIDELNSF